MFKEINVRELDRSPIQMISDDWALLTAGKEGDWNTMTVSWGGVGELWGKDVVFVLSVLRDIPSNLWKIR